MTRVVWHVLRLISSFIYLILKPGKDQMLYNYILICETLKFSLVLPLLHRGVGSTFSSRTRRAKHRQASDWAHTSPAISELLTRNPTGNPCVQSAYKGNDIQQRVPKESRQMCTSHCSYTVVFSPDIHLTVLPLTDAHSWQQSAKDTRTAHFSIKLRRLRSLAKAQTLRRDMLTCNNRVTSEH